MIGEYTFRSTGYSVIRINNLYFIVPPSLITRPTDQTIMENKEFTFNCTASGNPTPLVSNAKSLQSVSVAPSLIATPADQKVTESYKATFHCNATGNPTPKITWIKDGKIVGEGDTWSFDTKRNHSGKYWCLADNGLNPAVNASANLDVQCK